MGGQGLSGLGSTNLHAAANGERHSRDIPPSCAVLERIAGMLGSPACLINSVSHRVN